MEHFGVRGMRWGVTTRVVGRGTARTARTIGRGTATTARAVGRGTARTARFANRNRKATAAAAVAVGAVVAGALLSQRGQGSVASALRSPFRARGRGWVVEANDGRTFDILMENLRHEKEGRGQGFRNRNIIERMIRAR